MKVNLTKKILVGFLGIIAVPFLGTLFAGCSLAAVASIIAGVLHTFNSTWIPMMWMNKDIPAAYSIPISLLAALTCSIPAFIGYKGLKYYLRAFKSSFIKL